MPDPGQCAERLRLPEARGAFFHVFHRGSSDRNLYDVSRPRGLRVHQLRNRKADER